MQFILLMISAERQSTEALHWALHKAKETGRTVRIAYALENRAELSAAKKKLEEIERQCRTFQAPFEILIHEGAYFDALRELASKKEIDILVATEKKKPFFKKWFKDSEAQQIAGLVPCEIKMYQE